MSKKSVTRFVKAIEKYYPTVLADRSWDNVGLLIDSSHDDNSESDINVLLTIDLTQKVVDEAIALKSNIIMSYHPFIFSGLKSIRQTDVKQKSIVKLIQNKISVYSPHTAVDSSFGGVNDYLTDLLLNNIKKRQTEPIKKDPLFPNCGMGRIVILEKAVSLKTLIQNIKIGLNLKNLLVAFGFNKSINSLVETIAICAGSGSSIFKNVSADLYFTGELSHHETLFFTENGSSVIACNHSNTERVYLKIMKTKLENELLNSRIDISSSDKDPFEVL